MACWRYQTITWTYAEFPWMSFRGIHTESNTIASTKAIILYNEQNLPLPYELTLVPWRGGQKYL